MFPADVVDPAISVSIATVKLEPRNDPSDAIVAAILFVFLQALVVDPCQEQVASPAPFRSPEERQYPCLLIPITWHMANNGQGRDGLEEAALTARTHDLRRWRKKSASPEEFPYPAESGLIVPANALLFARRSSPLRPPAATSSVAVSLFFLSAPPVIQRICIESWTLCCHW